MQRSNWRRRRAIVSKVDPEEIKPYVYQSWQSYAHQHSFSLQRFNCACVAYVHFLGDAAVLIYKICCWGPAITHSARNTALPFPPGSLLRWWWWVRGVTAWQFRLQFMTEWGWFDMVVPSGGVTKWDAAPTVAAVFLRFQQSDLYKSIPLLNIDNIYNNSLLEISRIKVKNTANYMAFSSPQRITSHV